MSKKGFSNYVPAWAFADNAERFFPTSGPLPVSAGKKFRTGLDVYQHTGSATIYPAIQVSDDPESWPASTGFTRVGTHSATGEGVTYCTGADVDMTSDLQKLYYREGFTVVGSGSVLHHMMVAVAFIRRPA